MRKSLLWFRQRICQLIVIQIMLGILMALEKKLLEVADDSKNSIPPEIISNGGLKRASLDGLKELDLGLNLLKKNKNPHEVDGKREKLGNGYRKVRASYENIMILHRNLIEPEASTKLVETMEYFSILNQVALQRLVAHEMKHRVIQLESNKELKNIGESEIIIMAIKKIIYDNLNYLINNEVLKANDDFVAPNFCLVVIQYLLEQKYFKPDESLVIFKNEKALNLLAGHFEILAGASTGRPDIFYAIDILDDFMKVPKMSDVALIYHNFLYHLTLYHILKCHMKFNPEQLSEAAITVIVTNENALKECFGEYFNKENDFFKLDLK
ncbi:hypothetical protein BY996DRAFT_6411804 [Phakopsora pachyrhizi]|nr:hypothetical protein BY996DRAFT_6411804 [Phakopsora pachyrhizi]